MAKDKKKVATVNVDLLKQIGAGFVTRVGETEAVPLTSHSPPLIEINMADIVDGKALVRLTDEGKKMANANSATTEVNGAAASQFEIFTDAVMPPRKRAGRSSGSTSSKYPFDALPVAGFFFVPKSAELQNPVKTLASTISAKNMHYTEKTGETKQVEVTKRGPGNKAVLDANGDKVKHTVTRDVLKPTRKFAMRSVKSGQVCGSWVAPADGVLISREL